MTAEQLMERIDKDVERLRIQHIAAQKATKLFRYTDEEEQRIANAKRGAALFMATFGLAPKQPQVDLTHYENTNKTKWYDQRD